MEKGLLFIQPIVSEYRKSVVKQITLLAPQSSFWGTAEFQGVAPLVGLHNVDNHFETKVFKIFSLNFIWYKKLFSRFLKDKSDYVILSGINPFLIQFFLIFIIIRIFTNKKVYWWSQGKRFRQGFLGKKLRYFFYKYSDGVFLYSEGGKKNFLNEGLPISKLHVINNCLNYEDYGWLNYNLEDKYEKDFRIVYTGRLSERKKIIILLEAFKLIKEKGVKNIFLDIIGNGEQKERLEKYVQDNGMHDLVCFHGAKYGTDVHKYFLNGDLVVCPGAVGLSIVHAFSFGLPFITGEGDPAHSSELELLEVGKNGDYFLLNNKESLVEKILIWKDKINKNKTEYRQNCIQTIIKKEYLPNLVAQKIINALC